MVGLDDVIPEDLSRWWKEVPTHYHTRIVDCSDLRDLQHVFGRHLGHIVAWMLTYPEEVITLVYDCSGSPVVDRAAGSYPYGGLTYPDLPLDCER